MAEDPTSGMLHCVYHPRVETVLRCNRCSRPICPQCAVLTEVGYRCRDCIRSQQSVFFNLHLSDYPVAMCVAGVAAGLAAVLMGQAGFFIALLLSPFIGGAIAEAVHRAIGRRRGRRMWLAVGSAVIVGGLFGLLTSWFLIGPPDLFAFLIYLALATATSAGRSR